MPILQLCANLLIPNCLRSNLSYSPLAALELYVNVGKVLREAVFEYTKGLLTGNRIDWYQAFNMEK